MEQYKKKIEDCWDYLEKVVDILCNCGENQKLYIRIHGYEAWLVLRITWSGEIDKKIISNIKSVWITDLTSYSISKNLSVLKLVC